MGKLKEAEVAAPPVPLAHGGRILPAVTVDTYNEELRDDDGFVGDFDAAVATDHRRRSYATAQAADVRRATRGRMIGRSAAMRAVAG